MFSLSLSIYIISDFSEKVKILFFKSSARKVVLAHPLTGLAHFRSQGEVRTTASFYFPATYCTPTCTQRIRLCYNHFSSNVCTSQLNPLSYSAGETEPSSFRFLYAGAVELSTVPPSFKRHSPLTICVNGSSEVRGRGSLPIGYLLFYIGFSHFLYIYYT